MPRAKTAASPSPSPDMMNWRPGQPPARMKASPARTMPPKFHKASVCATGWPAKPGLNCPNARLVRNAATISARTPQEQVRVARQDQIAQRADGAEAAALGEKADQQADAERDQQRGVLAARPGGREEDRADRLAVGIAAEEGRDDAAAAAGRPSARA